LRGTTFEEDWLVCWLMQWCYCYWPFRSKCTALCVEKLLTVIQQFSHTPKVKDGRKISTTSSHHQHSAPPSALWWAEMQDDFQGHDRLITPNYLIRVSDLYLFSTDWSGFRT